MEKEEVTITFSGGISLTRKTSFKMAIEIARLLAQPQDSMLLEGGDPVETPPSSRMPSSAIEAINKAAPKTFPQRIVTLADFITKRDKGEYFDSQDVQTLLRRLGMPPQNFSRDMRQAEHVFNYIAKESNGQYIVTAGGREAVQLGFGSENPRTFRKRKVKKKKNE